MMRLAVLLALLLAVGGVLLWLPAADPELPPAPADPAAPDPAPVAAPSQRAIAATPPAPSPPPSGWQPETAAHPAGGPANVTLTVRSSATRAALAAFHVTFCTNLPTVALPVMRAEGKDGAAALQLAPGSRGELLVEADGHAPATAEVLAPPSGHWPLHLDLFLDPVAGGSGIALRVRGPDGAPIPHVRVQALALRGNPTDEWAGARQLWLRRASDAEGRYELPELAPGLCGIRLCATAADGALLPLLPFARIYSLDGSNGFREDALLEPGCLLTLDLVDRDGVPLDPEEHETGIELRRHGGDLVSRRWCQQADAGLVAAIDAPPGAGPCWLDEAVPGGLYTVTIRIDGRMRLDKQQIVLRAGERQVERLVVR
jgi:hypothetical protein